MRCHIGFERANIPVKGGLLLLELPTQLGVGCPNLLQFISQDAALKQAPVEGLALLPENVAQNIVLGSFISQLLLEGSHALHVLLQTKGRQFAKVIASIGLSPLLAVLAEQCAQVGQPFRHEDYLSTHTHTHKHAHQQNKMRHKVQQEGRCQKRRTAAKDSLHSVKNVGGTY